MMGWVCLQWTLASHAWTKLSASRDTHQRALRNGLENGRCRGLFAAGRFPLRLYDSSPCLAMTCFIVRRRAPSLACSRCSSSLHFERSGLAEPLSVTQIADGADLMLKYAQKSRGLLAGHGMNGRSSYGSVNIGLRLPPMPSPAAFNTLRMSMALTRRRCRLSALWGRYSRTCEGGMWRRTSPASTSPCTPALWETGGRQDEATRSANIISYLGKSHTTVAWTCPSNLLEACEG